MRNRISIIPAALVVLVAARVPAGAAVLELEPAGVAVLVADTAGVPRAALRFDLTDIPEAARIDAATLEWVVTGLSSEATSLFAAYPVAGTWEEAQDVEGDPLIEWEITPLDFSRTGGLVRLDLLELIPGWLAGATPGVVVATASLSEEGLAAQIGRAGLVVRYALRP